MRLANIRKNRNIIIRRRRRGLQIGDIIKFKINGKSREYRMGLISQKHKKTNNYVIQELQTNNNDKCPFLIVNLGRCQWQKCDDNISRKIKKRSV